MSGILPRDDNGVPAAGGVSTANSAQVLPFTVDSVTGRLLVDNSGGGSGTVTSVSVVTANGLAGSVANATTTPAITLSTTVTGIVKGNGTALSAAVANTDYQIPIALTTTGTSGAATFDGTTLNIPVYAAGTGDVVGPASATDNAVARFDLTTGKIIQNSAVLIADTTGVISGTQGVTLSGTTSGTLALVATAISGTNTITFPAATGTVALTSDIPSNVVTAAATFATDESILRSDGTSRGAQATSTNATLTDAGVLTLAGLATATGFSPTATTATGNRVYLPAANTIGISTNGTGRVQLNGTAMSPITNDGFALGSTTLMWSDLFLASGGVINFNNGDVTITHAANQLSFAGATTNGYRFADGPIAPSTNDGIALGTTALQFSDLFLAEGGVINFDNGDITLTQVGNSLTLSGGNLVLAEQSSIALDPAGSADGVWTGITVTATAGYTQAFGDLVYLSSVDSRWELADADAASTAGPVALAMVVVPGTDGTACTLLLQGIIRADAKFPTMTVGATQYVGETAGAIQGTIPTGADNIIRTVGYALTADELYFNPSTDWQVTVA